MPENKLEHILKLAATNEASSAEFYQILIESEIFVIGSLSDDTNAPVSTTLKADDGINIASLANEDGTETIPFFTSLEEMRKAVDEKQTFVALKASDFFNLTLGTHLVLNPASDYSKEFTPHEVSVIIGQPSNETISKHVQDKPMPVTIGQPANYPTKLVEALKLALPLYPQIELASLGLVSDPAGKDDTRLFIGLLSQTDIGSVVPELATHITREMSDGIPVAFTRISQDGNGIGSYMLESTEPFYLKSQKTTNESPAGKRKPWYKFWG